jgi:glycosyltransferase involved in cell wall biosynthesis
LDFQVCISDNCSTDETEQVVSAARGKIPIKYIKNSKNFGPTQNFLNVVAMADGEFAWLIGDDDLLLPDAIERINDLMGKHTDVDYFYVNSFHLSTEYVLSAPQPFDTAKLPDNMEPFSPRKDDAEMKFLDLIDPKISFDFLGGIFLSVFRRRNWITNVDAVDKAALSDERVFSNFDNTFPHIKIFARAFARSKAFFCARPLSVCLTGGREWAPMYRFVRSVRLIEALDEYRQNGLSYLKYLRCKNFALRNFLTDLAYMFVHRDNSGFSYIKKPVRLTFGYFLYPNFFFSIVYYLFGKMKS